MNLDNQPNRRALLSRIGTGMGTLGLAGILQADGLLERPSKRSSVMISQQMAMLAVNHPISPGQNVSSIVANRPLSSRHLTPNQCWVLSWGRLPGADEGREARVDFEISIQIHELRWSGLVMVTQGKCTTRVIRSMPDVPNHEPSLLNTGITQPTRPSMGSWLLWLGSENQNLPGFVVPAPASGGWCNLSNSLPGVFGAHRAAIWIQRVIPILQTTIWTNRPEVLRSDGSLNRKHLAERERDSRWKANCFHGNGYRW